MEHLFVALVDAEETAAVFLEPILIEDGYHVAPDVFLLRLRRLCSHRCILLTVDEIQSGMGRTGRLFAWQYVDLVPDVMVLAKALGSGFRIGAVLSRPEHMSRWDCGAHGSTFGGNPVPSAAALATLEVLEKEGLAQHAAEMGAYPYERLLALKARVPLIGDVRNRGMVLSLQLVKTDNSPNPELLKAVVHEDLARRLLTVGCGLYANMMRIIPPLIMTREQRQMGPKFAGKYSKPGGGTVDCSF